MNFFFLKEKILLKLLILNLWDLVSPLRFFKDFVVMDFFLLFAFCLSCADTKHVQFIISTLNSWYY